jgi:hypothetical protein
MASSSLPTVRSHRGDSGMSLEQNTVLAGVSHDILNHIVVSVCGLCKNTVNFSDGINSNYRNIIKNIRQTFIGSDVEGSGRCLF